MIYEKIRCMVCENTINAKLPSNNLTLQDKMWIVSRLYNWAGAQGEYGIFLCCEDCYKNAFDKSKGGKVGFLKDEYKKYAIKNNL